MGSLQVPDQGRGRSRFSKALPAIPPIDTTVADEGNRSVLPSLAPTNVSVPTSTTIAPIKLGDLPPPPPPRHNDDPRVPIQYTPLPPLPPSKQASKPTLTTTMTPTTPTASGSQKMKIPRRPVGGNNKPDTANPQTPKPTQPQALTQPQASSAAPVTSMHAPVSKTQFLPPTSQNWNPQQQQQQQQQSPPQQKELPPQLPAFRTSLFAIEQEPPQPPAKAAQRQVQSPPAPIKDQVQPMKKLPERESERESQSRQKEPLLLSNIQLQSHLFPKPPTSAAAATSSATTSNMRAFQKPQEPQPQALQTPQALQAPQAPQAPPEPSPQTIEYLQPSEFAQPLKSPSDSLSSILSAYSRSSTQSIIRSSDGTYSTRDSHAQESPDHQIPSSTAGPSSHYHEPSPSVSTITQSTAVPQSQSYQSRTAANGNGFTSSPPAPPPPSKDYVSQGPSSPPTRQAPANVDSSTSSPPKEQIWRRRSFKGSRDLPNLHLDYSHGSTASTGSTGTTQSQVTVVPTQTQDQFTSFQPTAAPQPPPKEVRGLPGRNIRPVHTQKQSVDEPTMGHGGSKLQQLKDKFHRSRKSEDKNSSKPAAPEPDNGPQSGRSVHNRPPTPEYQKEDIKTPHVDRITSPASPASSPEPKVGPLRRPQQGSSQTSELPPAPAPRNDAMAVNRRRVPNASSSGSEAIPTTDGPAEPRSTFSSAPPPSAGLSNPGSSLHPAKSLPDLKNRGTPTPITEPFPPLSAFPGSGRNSPAPDGPFARGRQFDGPGRPPPSRDGSARPDSRRGLDPVRNSGPDGSRFVRSSTGDLCYKGRDGTLYPEMKEPTQSPDPNAMRFPTLGGQPIAEGTILQAAPLKDSHYLCFQRHRSMLRQRNRRYPLTCQTCLKADAEDRWTCTFCSLRLCESCLGIFESNKKDLTGLINELAGQKPLSLSSPLRPGSSLGLSTMP